MAIKQELQPEFEKFAEISDISKDKHPFVEALTSAVNGVIKSLDEGKPVEEVQKELLDKNITGFLAGAVMTIACHFHERGSEMKTYWNTLSGLKKGMGEITPTLSNIKEK